MGLLRECHDQSRETNWGHHITGLELLFFDKKKGSLKIDQLSVGGACSYSSAPADSSFYGYLFITISIYCKLSLPANHRVNSKFWAALNNPKNSRIHDCGINHRLSFNQFTPWQVSYSWSLVPWAPFLLLLCFSNNTISVSRNSLSVSDVISE